MAEIVRALRLDQDTTQGESQSASPNAQRKIAGQPADAVDLPSNLLPEALQPVEFSAEKIIAGCQQFAWAQANQADVTEPIWRVMVGTLKRTDTPDIIHQFSNQHPTYTWKRRKKGG